MKIRILSFSFLLAFAGIFYSCAENSAADNTADEVQAETEKALSNMGAEVQDESNELDRNFREARNNIDNRMTELEGEMDGASEETKMELQEQFDELEDYRNDIDERMDRVGDKMESGWKDFKGDTKQGWKNFKGESDNLLKDIERSFDPEGDLE